MSFEPAVEPSNPQGDTPPPEEVPAVSEEQARVDLLHAAVKED